MRDILIGLVGYGFAGSIFHAPLIQSVSGLRLSTVVTSRRERVENELPAVRVASGIDEILSDRAIDLVVVASPSPTHFEVARLALAAGKHVIVDKPLATTAAEADELVCLASSKGLLLSAFQNRRWDNDYLTVKHCIDQRWLGAVYFYEAHFDRFRPQIKLGWREEPGRGSGILYDLGSHLIDQALQLFGMPRAVTADVFVQRPKAQVDDYFHLILDYGNHRAILHSSTLVSGPGPRFIVHGDAGSFLKYGADSQEDALRSHRKPGGPGWGSDPPGNYGELVLADGTHRTVETLRGSYEQFYEGIVACIQKGAPVPVDPRDARNGLVVIEAALRSSAEKRTVAI